MVLPRMGLERDSLKRENQQAPSLQGRREILRRPCSVQEKMNIQGSVRARLMLALAPGILSPATGSSNQTPQAPGTFIPWDTVLSSDSLGTAGMDKLVVHPSGDNFLQNVPSDCTVNKFCQTGD